MTSLVEEKARIAAELDFDKSPVLFDKVRAVIHPTVITNPNDIAAFETIGEIGLNH